MTRKVSDGVARIHLGLASDLRLGNLDAQRDWGYAGIRPSHVGDAPAPEPSDYVVATGIAHSVRDLCRIAFEHVGLDYQKHVVSDERLHRPAEVDHLLGKADKARAELGWEPTVGFEELVRMMVDADIERLRARSVPRVGRGSPD